MTMQSSGVMHRENAKSYLSVVMPRACGASSKPRLLNSSSDLSGILDRRPSRTMTAKQITGSLKKPHTGSAMEYFTWLSAKLDSIEAMPSSRVSLFFRNAS